MRNESFNNSLHVTCMIHICMYLVRLPISMLGLVIDKHCVKNIRIRSYSRPYCPAFELNMERYLSKCGKIRTRITPNTDTSHAVKTRRLAITTIEIRILTFKFAFSSLIKNAPVI